MIKVLVIARYHDSTTVRKIELLAQEPDLRLWLIYPRTWRSEIANQHQVHFSLGSSAIPLGMIGSPNDPHRALYKSLTFDLRQIKPDIIHAEEEPDSLTALQIVIARRLFAPNAQLLFHSWQNVNRHKTWSVRMVYQTAMRGSDAITCANSEAIEVLRQNGYRKPAFLQQVIGVDTRVFVPAITRQPQHGFIVGYVGRLVPEKDVTLLIEAVRQLHAQPRSSMRPHLWIMGDGPTRTALETQAGAAGLSEYVRFIPPASHTQVAELLHRLDALALPSRTTAVWKEQYGRVLIEAMACRVPVIGSDSGAIPEVIGDTGLIFPEGDATMLATRINTLMVQPELRDQLIEAAYQRVMQHYTQEILACQTALLYRQIMAPQK